MRREIEFDENNEISLRISECEMISDIFIFYFAGILSFKKKLLHVLSQYFIEEFRVWNNPD